MIALLRNIETMSRKFLQPICRDPMSSSNYKHTQQKSIVNAWRLDDIDDQNR